MSLVEDPARAITCVATCANCGAGLAGSYCSRCGERRATDYDHSIRHILLEAIHECTQLDAKVFATLRALVTKPGVLTQDYFAGRRQRSITPLKLFLTIFALHFLVNTTWARGSVYNISAVLDSSPPVTAAFSRQAERRGLTPDILLDRFEMRYQRNVSLLQLLHVIGAALGLLAMHRGRYLVEHFVLAAHFVAFSFFWTLCLWPLMFATDFGPGRLDSLLLGLTSVAANMVWLFLAQRRCYGGSRAVTTAKTIGVAVAFYRPQR